MVCHDSSSHLNTVGSSHQQEQSAIGGKLPPVVGIYRPPAARRALNLAENIVHQLAPPAACEHPNDYGHLTPSTQHPSAPCHQQVQLLLHTAAGGTEPDKILIAPNSREGHLLRKDRAGVCEKTGLAAQRETVQSSSQTNVPDGTRQIGSNDSTGNGNSTTNIGVTSPRNNRPPRERRPDRAVYVPRARRSLTTPPVATVPVPSSQPETAAAANISKESSSPTKGLSRTASNRVQLPETCTSLEPVTPAISQTSTVSSKAAVKLKDGKRKLSEFTTSGQLQSGNTDTLNCDTVIEAPLHAHATGGSEVSLEALKKRSHSLEEQQPKEPTQVEVKEGREALTVSSSYLKEESLEQHCDNLSIEQQEEIAKEDSDCTNSETVATMQRNNQRNRNVRNTAGTAPSPLATGMLITDPNETEKIDRDEKELRRASQEINRSNRRIMKQTFNSDVLEIGEPTPPTTVQKPVKVKRTPAAKVSESVDGQKATVTPATNVIPNGKTTNSEAVKSTADDEEDADDWESMYDDNGDCLNPKMLAELTSAVGKVSIETPQSDYKLFETKQAMLNEEEFPHVLEVSNFPAEFKTQDLMMLFSQYKETGFDIKWVDDTHALAVFSSSKIAAEVLTTGLSFARVKPLAEATAESRSKARKCSSSLQPYRTRPETCAAMARRMVSSALGVKLKTAPEERENERRLLREAKERKRLAAKQRDEVWES
uniref:R3H domain-containing protein n=1 Tax=Anopheles culicifacies TaxID=139723 RepID=A0A182LY03_9DIPT